MSRSAAFKRPFDVIPADVIHASFFTLLGSAAGLVFSGIGLLLSWHHPATLMPVTFETAGALLLAIAISTHVSHLSKRIGTVGVGASVLALYVWAASWLPFALNRKRYLMINWQHYFYSCWGLSLALFALAAFVALRIKEMNERRGEEDPLAQIHMSFTSLLFVAAGLLIFSIGFFDMAAHLSGERLSWTLQFVGPLLIAIGVTRHLEHATKHLGYAGALLGILSVTIWALCSLPFVIRPALAFDGKWGLRISNGLFSLPYFLIALTLTAIAIRKRSIESANPRD
jgi:hypothetical protein